MDSSSTVFRSRRRGDDNDLDAAASRSKYRPQTLSALTAEADSLQRPVGAAALGLKNVRGAVTSAYAIPEDPSQDQTLQNDIHRALDHNHSRLTFRANLTTLTESERRKILSYQSGEDMYQKMSKKQDVPEWLNEALGSPAKETEEFLLEPRNAITPVQPYIPPHMDPISPAIVPRDYWKNHARTDHIVEQSRHHRSRSSRPVHRSTSWQDRKRSRSPEDRHHRHSKSEKRRHRSERSSPHKSPRRRSRRRPDSDSASEEARGRRRKKLEPYVDPGLVPDPLAVAGAPARVSPQKLRRQKSGPIDVAGWVRSTSQPREASPHQSGGRGIPGTVQVPQHRQPTPSFAPVPTGYDGQQAFPERGQVLQIQARNIRPILPVETAPRHLVPVRPTASAVFSSPPILQPIPTRPIQMSRLMMASTPRIATPVVQQAPADSFQCRTSLVPVQTPLADQGTKFRFAPVIPQNRTKFASNFKPAFASSVMKPFIPVTPMAQAVQHAHHRQQGHRQTDQIFDSPEDEVEQATDSGYGQTSWQNVGYHNGRLTHNRALTPALTATVVDAEEQRCPNEHEDETDRAGGAQQYESTWNPILANCTAARPRRLTLRQTNGFEAQDYALRAREHRNNISVVKGNLEARDEH